MALTFETSNLLASCGKTHGQTCGHAKGGQILPDWLHPYEHPNLATLFKVRDDGYVEAKSDAPDNAQSAIDETLKLNHQTLKSQRRRHIALLNNIQNDEELSPEDIAGFFIGFPTLTKFVLGLT